jgi:ribosomal protein L11 methyltransferase
VLVESLSLVHFSVPIETAEAVGNLLTEEGGGVEQRDEESTPPSAPGTTDFLVWMPPADISRRVQQVETLLKSLQEMGIPTSSWHWKSEEVKPESWQDAYKRHFSVTRLGRRFVLKPSWEHYTPQPEDLLIELDPGMAFGTGLHASTRLVLHILERLARTGPTPQTVLDLGCGTGILAIATARLWPHTQIVAIDNDPSAAQICQENVSCNRLDGRIKVMHRSPEELEINFNLVLANLSMETLSMLQPMMRRLLSAFGRLVLSGLLAEQAGDLCRLYTRDLSMEPEYSEEIDGWRAHLLRRRN